MRWQVCMGPAGNVIIGLLEDLGRFLLEFLRRLWILNIVFFFAGHLAPQIVPNRDFLFKH